MKVLTDSLLDISEFESDLNNSRAFPGLKFWGQKKVLKL